MQYKYTSPYARTLKDAGCTIKIREILVSHKRSTQAEVLLRL